MIIYDRIGDELPFGLVIQINHKDLKSRATCLLARIRDPLDIGCDGPLDCWCRRIRADHLRLTTFFVPDHKATISTKDNPAPVVSPHRFAVSWFEYGALL